MKRISIIGSHGLYANYGGWDQLVKNLAEKKSDKIYYIIFNSKESPKNIIPPQGVEVKRIDINASGFQGLFYDFWSILFCFNKVDTLVLLGVQGIPLIPILRLFRKFRVVSNVGGIEWERPKFGILAKQYLRFCFNLSFRFSDYVILDNPHYKKYIPERGYDNVVVIPYGGEIDTSKEIDNLIIQKFPFLQHEFYLSISRSLQDNLLDELCESFIYSRKNLVLISNFTNSTYGQNVYSKYSNYSNITLINGLYFKPELDLIRRSCKAYIHTHTLCGTAPSLVEMIISRRPIISIDNPQNRFTLHNQAFFFKSFPEVQFLINETNDLSSYIPNMDICRLYYWDKIVSDYEMLY